jgi:hypothetical protein
MTSEPTKRTKSIKVYLFEDEKNAIEEKAAATGTTASEYLRSCGLKRALAVRPTPDLIAVQGHASMVKSELMMLSHLAKKANNQQMLDTVNSVIAQIDLCLDQVFQMNNHASTSGTAKVDQE